VKTEGLVEILTTRVGPRAATDTWSYPDYVDLRDANTGTALVAGRTGKARSKRLRTGNVCFTNYFQTIGVTLFADRASARLPSLP
jgi:hypothetical protein